MSTPNSLKFRRNPSNTNLRNPKSNITLFSEDEDHATNFNILPAASVSSTSSVKQSISASSFNSPSPQKVYSSSKSKQYQTTEIDYSVPRNNDKKRCQYFLIGIFVVIICLFLLLNILHSWLFLRPQHGFAYRATMSRMGLPPQVLA